MIPYLSNDPLRRDWLLREETLAKSFCPNIEAVFCQGNGYMGVRAAFEEEYAFQRRGTFLCGTYNRAQPGDVSELPNCADLVHMRFFLGGQELSVFEQPIEGYFRELDLETGELVRAFRCTTSSGQVFDFRFQRFVSLDDLHLIVSRVTVTPRSADCEIELETGIDGRSTNSGSQHFIEGVKQVFHGSILSANFITSESALTVSAACVVRQGETFLRGRYYNRRRQLMGRYRLSLRCDEPQVVEKLSVLYTSRDEAYHAATNGEPYPCEALMALQGKSYASLLDKSAARWAAYWQAASLQLTGGAVGTQLAVNAALYHMRIMTAFGRSDVSICAKGLTGEGYKGHIFWDAEMFMLPFFLQTFPEQAKQLLLYRYARLSKARENAMRKGNRGARFPWESAGSGEEETPEFAAVNIETGKLTPIINGMKEVHITADIAYMVMAYYRATGDIEFMLRYGCEMVLSCAEFWSSFCKRTARGYEILGVVGPDEYTEDIDNNAFTNRMAQLNLQNAQECAALWIAHSTDGAQAERQLESQYNLPLYRDIAEHMYFPPAKDGILAQDDTFLSKPRIDIEKYQREAGKQTILFDYTRPQVVELQVAKQADLAMLLYLQPDDYDMETRRKNLAYYEAVTIHDSSLSKSIYGMVAMDVGNHEEALQFFLDALAVDFGVNAANEEGIHAASVFGIWNLVVRGMCGARVSDAGILQLRSNLLPGYTSLRVRLWHRGALLEVTALPGDIYVKYIEGDAVEVDVFAEGAYQRRKIGAKA